MGNFCFKRFGIRQERTAMKVNTDGALLGAWMEILSTDARLLDIGTGSGVIALMAAQRMAAKHGEEPFGAVKHIKEPKKDTVHLTAIRAAENCLTISGQAERKENKTEFDNPELLGTVLIKQDVTGPENREVVKGSLEPGAVAGGGRKNGKAVRTEGEITEPVFAVPDHGMTREKRTEDNKTEIVGLEIDRGSYEDACLNFKNAPWKGLRAVPLSLQQYAAEYSDEKFDLIFCNPPYFIRSLKCPDGSRAAARHTHTLEQGELIRDTLKLIRPGGRLALILPAAEGERFLEKIRFLENHGRRGADTARLFFRLVRLCKVYTTLRKPAKRYLMELRAEITNPVPVVSSRPVTDSMDTINHITLVNNIKPIEVPELIESVETVSSVSAANPEHSEYLEKSVDAAGEKTNGRNAAGQVNKDNSPAGILSADTEKTKDGRENCCREELVIQDNGVYTPEFKALMKEFYLYL